MKRYLTLICLNHVAFVVAKSINDLCYQRNLSRLNGQETFLLTHEGWWFKKPKMVHFVNLRATIIVFVIYFKKGWIAVYHISYAYERLFLGFYFCGKF